MNAIYTITLHLQIATPTFKVLVRAMLVFMLVSFAYMPSVKAQTNVATQPLPIATYVPNVIVNQVNNTLVITCSDPSATTTSVNVVNDPSMDAAANLSEIDIDIDKEKADTNASFEDLINDKAEQAGANIVMSEAGNLLASFLYRAINIAETTLQKYNNAPNQKTLVTTPPANVTTTKPTNKIVTTPKKATTTAETTSKKAVANKNTKSNPTPATNIVSKVTDKAVASVPKKTVSHYPYKTPVTTTAPKKAAVQPVSKVTSTSTTAFDISMDMDTPLSEDDLEEIDLGDMESLLAEANTPKLDIKKVDGRLYINDEPASPNDPRLVSKNSNYATSAVRTRIAKSGPAYKYSTTDKIVLTNIYEEETPCHAHYDYNWNNSKIHAYKYDLTKMPQKVEFLLTHGLDGDFAMPVVGRITSNFGPRRPRHHNGIDIKLNKGDDVRSAFDGKIRIAQYSKSYGYIIVVRHFNGLETFYAHLSKLVVKEGDKVKAGDVIGLGGSTGRSTGNHLHFEVRYKGHPLNPNEMIDFNRGRLKSHTFIVDRTYFSSSNPYESAHDGSATSGSGISYYTIKRGDSLSKIASRNGTSVSRLCRLNGMSTRSTLRVGKRLRVR